VVVFPARDIQAVVPEKAKPVFGLVLFWTPACAGVTGGTSGQVKKIAFSVDFQLNDI